MQTIRINFPESVNLPENEVLVALATRLYDTGRINIEQAAELAKCDIAPFIEELMAQSLQELAGVRY